jgi:hypothetical protein
MLEQQAKRPKKLSLRKSLLATEMADKKKWTAVKFTGRCHALAELHHHDKFSKKLALLS